MGIAEQQLFMDINRLLDLAQNHFATGRYSMVQELCNKALEQEPHNLEASYLLAKGLAKSGEHQQAADLITVVVENTACVPLVVRDYVEFMTSCGRQQEAIARLKRLLVGDPKNYDYWYLLARLWKGLQQAENFLQAVSAATLAANNHPPKLYELSELTGTNYFPSLTERLLTQSVELSPSTTVYSSAFSNLLKQTGRADQATSYFRRTIPADHNQPVDHSYLTNYLMNFICTTDHTVEQCFEEHRKWGAAYIDLFHKENRFHPEEYLPDQTLNIGYLSADFCAHPVAIFIEPLISCHVRYQFNIFLYSNVKNEDYVTEQIRQRPCVWRNISGISDNEACRIIMEDKIDILVDLNGWTRNNRMRIFAAKPAPVQVSWLGYAHSTGLSTIDYRFTDAVADPPGMTEHLHTEQLYRLPDCFLGYHPPLDPPELSPLHLDQSGYISFVALNNLAKTNEQLLGWWCEILKQVPASTLTLKYAAFTSDYRFKENWYAKFAARGITADRIILKGHHATVHEHLSAMGKGDIFLDAYPYNGTTTTCEALWMGVPVITLAGPSHVSRVSASLLTCIGAPELVASSPEEYIEKAVQLADDRDRLLHYRSNLRGMMQGSPLMDYHRFARKIESAYRDIWQRWHTIQ